MILNAHKGFLLATAKIKIKTQGSIKINKCNSFNPSKRSSMNL